MGHGERRRELERQFPGWEIWYVPREPDGATWCARPRMLLSAESPEDLAADVRAAHSQVVPDPLLLASPVDDRARVRRLGKLEGRAGAARCCPALKMPMKAALARPMWGWSKAPQRGWLRGLGGGGAAGRG